MARFPVFVLVWILFIAIKLPTMLLGLLVVPLLYRYRHRPFHEVPKVFLPWLNPEDWNDGHRGTPESLPQWWMNQEGAGFKCWYDYHAKRNPAKGLRNFESIDLDFNPELVE